MELTIEAVSKNKRGFLADGRWYNADSGLSGEAFSALNKGDKVSADIADDKWVKSFKVVEKGAAQPAKPTYKKTFTPGGRALSPEEASRIARGNAVNAVMGSPYVGKWLEEVGGSGAEGLATMKEFIVTTANYIENGTFSE